MDFEKDSLAYHERSPAGKIYTGLSKSVDSQHELSLAYSPGVAGPCREIDADQDASFRYTGRGNLVGVVSNGSAVLGLGNIGPYAAKPVMEGKAMLFKKLANIDVFDVELDCPDIEAFCAAVKALEPTFGGINLEDIKAPECFYIEEKLRSEMNIPIFHDDQHGTAIIASAALLNALEIAGKSIENIKIVVCGAGAAAIACANLFFTLGVPKEHLTMTDSKGVVRTQRTDLNSYKQRFARDTDKTSLAEVLEGADVFLGVSGPGVLTAEMLLTMAKNPIIFALANPEPEILPQLARETRSDAIIATGRSDYPNQVNNVLGFPFIFRGALDVRATGINEEMKLAAVRAIAALAKEDIPDVVRQAYAGKEEVHSFGRDYLIPKPMDPRVLMRVAPAVAKAAMDSGVHRRSVDMQSYTEDIEKILGPTRSIVRRFRHRISQSSLQRGKGPLVVLSDGGDERSWRAATQIADESEVRLAIVGRTEELQAKAQTYRIERFGDRIALVDPERDARLEDYAQRLFAKRCRKGITQSHARTLMRSPGYFGAMMLETGDADGFLGGLSEPYRRAIRPVLSILGTEGDRFLAGIYMIVVKNRLMFFADTTVNVQPSAEQLADIAEATARMAAGHTQEQVRVAFLSFASFGANSAAASTKRVRAAVELLQSRNPGFPVDGEMQVDVALNPQLQKTEFPFCTLGGPANVLIFPDLGSANISYKLLISLADDVTPIGPILVGGRKPAHVLQRSAKTEEVVNLAYLTADQSLGQHVQKP